MPTLLIWIIKIDQKVQSYMQTLNLIMKMIRD